MAFRHALPTAAPLPRKVNESISFPRKTQRPYFNLQAPKTRKSPLTLLSVCPQFDSVEDIIEHYKYFPIVLIDGKDKTGARREQCYLTRPLPLGRLSSPR